MRARAVLPLLAKEHELLVFAGGDAYEALSGEWAMVNVPTLQFHHSKSSGRISVSRTLLTNSREIRDILFGGPSVRAVAERLGQFKADVVVSDSEAFTLRAAKRLGVPRISFDHFGVLAYCRPSLSATDRVVARAEVWMYQTLLSRPDAVVVTGFFEAPPRRADVTFVGPVIREAVRNVKPTRGDHLLVYISKGADETGRALDVALPQLDLPAKVYGTPVRGQCGKIEYKPLSNLPFIEDLASCRAVIATTGNQLLSESIYYRKPFLGIPVACLEQRMNARQIVQLGIGEVINRHRITPERIRQFLDNEETFYQKPQPLERDGASAAAEAISQHARKLGADRARRRECGVRRRELA